MTLYRKKPEIVEAYDFSKTKVDKHGKPLYDGVMALEEYQNSKRSYFLKDRDIVDGKVYSINSEYLNMPIGNEHTILVRKDKYNQQGNFIRTAILTKNFLKNYEPIEESAPQAECIIDGVKCIPGQQFIYEIGENEKIDDMSNLDFKEVGLNYKSKPKDGCSAYTASPGSWNKRDKPQEEVTFEDCEELIKQRFGNNSNYETWGRSNNCHFWNHAEGNIKFTTNNLKQMYEFIKTFKPE